MGSEIFLMEVGRGQKILMSGEQVKKINGIMIITWLFGILFTWRSQVKGQSFITRGGFTIIKARGGFTIIKARGGFTYYEVTICYLVREL